MTNPHPFRPISPSSSVSSGCGCDKAGPADGAAIPLACNLAVFSPAERTEHLARSRRLFRSIECLTEESDGYVLALASSCRAEIERWVEAEQRCCPFYRFEVSDDGGASLLIRISGPEGAKEIFRTGLEQYS